MEAHQALGDHRQTVTTIVVEEVTEHQDKAVDAGDEAKVTLCAKNRYSNTSWLIANTRAYLGPSWSVW